MSRRYGERIRLSRPACVRKRRAYVQIQHGIFEPLLPRYLNGRLNGPGVEKLDVGHGGTRTSTRTGLDAHLHTLRESRDQLVTEATEFRLRSPDWIVGFRHSHLPTAAVSSQRGPPLQSTG